MIIFEIAGAILAVCAIGVLVAALLRPERF